MPVLHVTEAWSGSSVGRVPAGREAVRVFHVVADSLAEAESAVDPATGLTVPGRGDSYPGSTTLKADRVIVRSRGLRLYEAVATYATPGLTLGGGGEDPLAAPRQESWDFGSTQEPVDRDIHGAAILNTAGDPPSQQPTRDVDQIFLNITRNEATFSPAAAMALVNAVNGDTFRGAPPGTVKCRRYAPSAVQEAGASYVTATYQFEFRLDGFKQRMANRGFYMLVAGKRVRILEDDLPGALVAESERSGKAECQVERFLGESGQLTDEPLFLEWDQHDVVNFAGLSL